MERPLEQEHLKPVFADRIARIRLATKKSPVYRAALSIKPLPAGSTLILAGEPSTFRAAIPLLLQSGYRIASALSPRNVDMGIKEIPIVSRDHYSSKLPYPVVFSGSPRKHQFSSSYEFGQTLRWLDTHLVPKQNSRLADPKLFLRHSEEIVTMYELLADEDSRATFRSILASRHYNDNGYLRISAYQEYRHPLVKVIPGDVVVDAGAHVGKVARSFAKACGPTGAVYAFEPDPATFAELTRRNKDLPRVQTVNAGVWDSSTTLSFSNESGSSAGHALNEDGPIKVSVVSLDDFFHQPGRRPPTIMKFDVEGSEAAALAGAEGIIKTYKPRLMVSAYHRPKDLWELIFQIKAIRPDYQFYLGHHNFYHTETDVYAV